MRVCASVWNQKRQKKANFSTDEYLLKSNTFLSMTDRVECIEKQVVFHLKSLYLSPSLHSHCEFNVVYFDAGCALCMYTFFKRHMVKMFKALAFQWRTMQLVCYALCETHRSFVVVFLIVFVLLHTEKCISSDFGNLVQTTCTQLHLLPYLHLSQTIFNSLLVHCIQNNEHIAIQM